MLKVVVHEKGGRTQRFNFESDQFSVGREEDNDLVLDRVNISKHHLRLRRAQGAVEIVDLSSTNGTYVNGRKVGTPRQVRKSDRIYVGDYILMLEGDDDAIAPVLRSEIIVAGEGQHPERRSVAVPPNRRDGGEPLSPTAVPKPLAHLTGDDNDDVLTSARRVAPAGMESTFVDKVVNRILQTALANINSLDPVREAEISEEDVAATNALIESLVADMRRAGEFEEGLDVDLIIGQAKRELLGLGPLSELMKDDDIREIQVVGSGSIRIVHDRNEGGTDIELTARRFSGDRALILATQRLARTWGFLHEGTQLLEGKVDEGFWMYALLPPTQVRHPVVNLRRQRTDASNLAALVQEGVLSADMAELLAAAIRGSRRILVSASGGINLDRFMGALLGEIPEELRVCCISDSGRLGDGRRGWMQVRRMTDPADTLGLSDALGVLLRGGVDVLVSQRCRHEDAAAVMDAFAGATRGAIVSLWGIDSAHALWRLAGLSTVASGAIGALTVSLARSVDLLVRLNVGLNEEGLQVIEIIEPRVAEDSEIVHTPIFRAVRADDATSKFESTGEEPSFIRELAERGIAVPQRMFESE